MITDRYGALASADELEAALREIGAERYHILHPFHRLLHTGKLDQGQVQAWALNRYYYQSRIPMKDAALLSRCEDRELRREWLVRLLDHDGIGEQEGGIARWLRLCQGARARSRLCPLGGGHPAGHQVRGRRLCPLRARAHAARGRGLVADRAVRAQDPRGAHPGPAAALQLRQRGDGGLFPPPARPGAARCRLRPGLCPRACRHAPRSGWRWPRR